MRWSWTSFAAGVAGGGVLAALLWLALREPAENVYLFPEADLAATPPLAAEQKIEPPGTPPDVAARSSGRRHVTPEPRAPRDDAPPPIEDTGGISISSGRYTIGKALSEPIRISFSGGKNGWIQIVTDSGGKDTAPALLKWAKSRAREVYPDDPVARGEATSRMRADSYAERAEGLGLATRIDPPPLRLLLRAARDRAYPDLRGAALLAASEVAGEDPDVRAAILELALDGDSKVRRTATSLLAELGAEGAERAAQILLAGDYTSAVVGQLTAAVAQHGDVATFLGASPPPDAALSVVRQLASRLAEPQTDADRQLAATLPQLVRPLLETPEASEHAAQVLPQLAALGHGAFLRGIAATPLYRSAVRGAAVRAALGNEETRSDGISAAGAILTDPTADVALARDVLAAVSDEWLDDATLRGALESASRTHPSAWVRDAARSRLADHDPAARGAIVVHEAKYGADGDWVDVTDALRGAIRDGRLNVQAGNELGGDPKVGAHKTLRVEYSLGGERRLETVGEGGWLKIP